VIYHAAIQEILSRVEFSGNDQSAKLLRVIRTETTAGAVPLKKGAIGEYKQRVNESGSIFAPVFSGTKSVTVVPHSRVTGLYFLERKRGTGQKLFSGRRRERDHLYCPWSENSEPRQARET
jgi:hypothetical protein